MASQGLRATPAGIKAAKTALIDKTLSQHRLAIALGITRQPVSKFFAGEPVSRSCFVQICQYLGLSWQKVAGLPEEALANATTKSISQNLDINSLVLEIRQKRQDKIQDQCATVQMLDIGRVIPLEYIYTNVYVVEQITSQQWLEIDDLSKDFSFFAGFIQVSKEQLQRKIPALDAANLYSKLMLLGKPGSGKTTFLKYLALECNKAEFQAKRIAIFISLKDFAEDVRDNHEINLGEYISQEFLSSLIEDEATASILTEGKALILLDGLDEVPSEYIQQINREIRRFTQTYYKNRFIISCRVGGQQHRVAGFTEVEIADFDIQQVKVFVKNWFSTVAYQSLENGEAQSNLFIHQLYLPENQRIRELTATPILLHIICLLFQKKLEFPAQPASLYAQVLNLIVRRWDDIKGIKRDDTELFLNWNNKIKLLCQIAAITFAQKNYFFEYTEIQYLMAEILEQLSEVRNCTCEKVDASIPVVNARQASDSWLLSIKNLQDSEKLLKIFESEHGLLVQRSQGIYSFSHLALQEYLTAKYFVANYSEKSLHQLVNYTTEERWHNVILLSVSMLKSADIIFGLMKQKIDFLVADDEPIQNFLVWLQQKSHAVTTQYPEVAVRAFYLVCIGRSLEVFLDDCDFPRRQVFSHEPNYGLERAIVGNLAFHRELAIDEFLTSTFTCAGELDFACDYIWNDEIFIDHAQALMIAFEQALDLIVESEFKQSLIFCQQALSNHDINADEFRTWWKANGKSWSKNFREILIKYRNICHDWQFAPEQIEMLQKYYHANKLLIDCLNICQNISAKVKQDIENTLLLAIAQIKLHSQML
ncbi:NACHT domain-containing NTPase [Nostoc sp. FACHB-110]|uniref:NACHT domain-containing protein n=1 Tax=Nostoc sp. FACHB-110 TaxID=2692834 RepID=UPI0016868B92|nr:NACHT domain-containing NTPase [Nostoc sp. FACHB-110]MBD2435721.1 NACHT domain-containing NTPase [Nostoc sp. FACHB-110]